MATLVGNDPEAGSEQTLQDRVQSPETSPHRLRGDVLWRDEGVGEVECGGKECNVAGNVCHALESRTLEAVSGNGIANLLDGVVGDLELVSVCIEKDTSLVLGKRVVDRAERGDRGRRGRLSWRVIGRHGGRVCHAGGGSGGALKSRARREGGSGSHCDDRD